MINNINIIFPFATTRQRKKGKPPQRGITHQRRMYHRGSISVRDGLGWSMRADKATLQGFHWRLTAGPWPWEGRGGVLWILVSRQNFFTHFRIGWRFDLIHMSCTFSQSVCKKCEKLPWKFFSLFEFVKCFMKYSSDLTVDWRTFTQNAFYQTIRFHNAFLQICWIIAGCLNLICYISVLTFALQLLENTSFASSLPLLN